MFIGIQNIAAAIVTYTTEGGKFYVEGVASGSTKGWYYAFQKVKALIRNMGASELRMIMLRARPYIL